MTKADLARAIYDRHGGISNQEAQRIVDLIFETIKHRLLSGDDIHIVERFVSFDVNAGQHNLYAPHFRIKECAADPGYFGSACITPPGSRSAR